VKAVLQYNKIDHTKSLRTQELFKIFSSFDRCICDTLTGFKKRFNSLKYKQATAILAVMVSGTLKPICGSDLELPAQAVELDFSRGIVDFVPCSPGLIPAWVKPIWCQ
jgi:hypothetical protein